MWRDGSRSGEWVRAILVFNKSQKALWLCCCRAYLKVRVMKANRCEATDNKFTFPFSPHRKENKKMGNINE